MESSDSRSSKSGSLRRLRNARGPVFLGLWFFAPPLFVVQSTEGGGVSVSFGASVGQYESVSRNCAGDVISSYAHPVNTQGGTIEYETPGAPLRLAAFGGSTSVSSAPSDPSAFPGYSGRYSGFLVAWESDRVGLGLGSVFLPAHTASPSAYLRFGDRNGRYFQADLFSATPLLTATGLLRGGVGFRQDQVRGFVGLSAGRALDLDDNMENGGPFAEIGLSLSERVDLLVAGSWFESEQNADWGAGLGLRYRFGH